MRVGLQGDLQFIEAVELGREPVFDGLHAQGDRQVSSAHARKALDQRRFGGADESAGGKGLDARAFDRRLEGEVEIRQRESCGKVRQSQGRLDAPGLAFLILGLQECVEKAMR